MSTGRSQQATARARPLPRVARVPHTSKVPDACPHCGSHVLARRGTRRKKLEIVQLWSCASCKRVFTPGPPALHNKTYPLRMILSTLTDYNLGYSLSETAARLKNKTNRRVAPSTITSWLYEYRQHTSYRRLRGVGLTRFSPEQTLRSIKLYHRQVYGFAYHRSKLELLRAGQLDDKRSGDIRFAGLADFLESIPTTCPHDLFRRDDDPKARASQAHPEFADVSRIIVNRKENAATQTAALIIPAVGNNKLRHETLQRFMLANDSVTVAIEIPIWLTEDDIAELERQHGIELAPRDDTRPRVITGHIDFLQVRNGCVHILDYKPDARTNKPIAQLAIYALALTRLVPGLKLFDIKCAWFNEQEYCEMFPRTLFSRPSQ
jgi:transposase-like protein